MFKQGKKQIINLFFFFFFFFLFFFFFAKADDPKKESEETLKIAGTVIDNESAEKYLKSLDIFILRYPKAQAVLPVSVESGYSIYSEGELYRFNKESSVKITEFLEERNNVLKVVIEAKEVDDELELLSIKNEYSGVRGGKNE